MDAVANTRQRFHAIHMACVVQFHIYALRLTPLLARRWHKAGRTQSCRVLRREVSECYVHAKGPAAVACGMHHTIRLRSVVLWSADGTVRGAAAIDRPGLQAKWRHLCWSLPTSSCPTYVAVRTGHVLQWPGPFGMMPMQASLPANRFCSALRD
jgi:hypothetical protein